ncbi:hypothetical protein E4T49_02010 [Aureobasidium sp. EXF-10728]|nr:hypothetical protein E4T49_02010 [Aureobasidium sp. EXF-10728]
MADDEDRVTMPFKFVTGFDARFPNQNQTKHCWQNYVDYHKCILAKGEDFKPCRQVHAFFPPTTPVTLSDAHTVLPRLQIPLPQWLGRKMGRPARTRRSSYTAENGTFPMKLDE